MKKAKFAIVPKGECARYLKPGEKYPIIRWDGDTAFETSVDGKELYCLCEGSAHLNGGNWILL